VSDVIGQHFGGIAWMMLLGIIGWSMFRERRARALADEGRCAKCKAVAAETVPAPAGEGVLCIACATARRRQDWIAVRLWVGLIALFVVTLGYGSWERMTVPRGSPYDFWKFAGGIILFGIAGPLWIVHRYRLRGEPPNEQPRARRAAEQSDEADKP
jgi:hypothetical protein